MVKTLDQVSGFLVALHNHTERRLHLDKPNSETRSLVIKNPDQRAGRDGEWLS